MTGLRISQLAERVGVPATTLRFYETEGLLPARRAANGYREYEDRDVERARFVVTAKELGLPLARIRELVALWQDGPCRDVRERLLRLVAEQLAELDGRVRDLHELRDHLHSARRRFVELPPRTERCDPTCVDLTGLPVPVACSLSGDDHRARLDRWAALLSGTEPRRLGAAVRVELPVARLAELAALVADEVECCPFFTFALTVTADGVCLDATAPAEAGPLLDALFVGRYRS